jgi:cytochrome P450
MGSYSTGGFAPREWLTPAARWLLIRIFRFFDHHPFALRIFHALLRPRPVWRIGHTVLVTGDRQARDVLSRDDDFPLPEKRAAKFLHGPFILGMTRTPQFRVERAALTAALHLHDRDWVRRLCQVESAAAIQDVVSNSCDRLDVVADLSTRVGRFLILHYFGVDYSGYPTGCELIDDLRRLGAVVASPDAERPEFLAEAGEAAERVIRHVEQRLREAEDDIRQGSHIGRDTVLRRLIFNSMQPGCRMDHDAIRRNIIGVLLPGTALVNRAFATSLVQLLEKRSLREPAIEAARRHDDAALEGYLLEALRFHPVFPIMPRHCPHETVLPGFRREYRIGPGRDVLVSVASAMFDPQGALFTEAGGGGYPADPRVRARHLYRHFGGGAHECLGQHIALPQMAAMLEALLQLDDLKCTGRIEYDNDEGISPRHLEVAFTRSDVPAGRAVPAVTPVVSGIPSRTPV